jgi:hypothetical protein
MAAFFIGAVCPKVAGVFAVASCARKITQDSAKVIHPLEAGRLVDNYLIIN